MVITLMSQQVAVFTYLTCTLLREHLTTSIDNGNEKHSRRSGLGLGRGLRCAGEGEGCRGALAAGEGRRGEAEWGRGT